MGSARDRSRVLLARPPMNSVNISVVFFLCRGSVFFLETRCSLWLHPSFDLPVEIPAAAGLVVVDPEPLALAVAGEMVGAADLGPPPAAGDEIRALEFVDRGVVAAAQLPAVLLVAPPARQRQRAREKTPDQGALLDLFRFGRGDVVEDFPKELRLGKVARAPSRPSPRRTPPAGGQRRAWPPPGRGGSLF